MFGVVGFKSLILKYFIMTQEELKVLKKIDDWTLLTYLRDNRNWMVQSHYAREDIEHMLGSKFTKSEWYSFTSFACDKFDFCKCQLMYQILICWIKEKDTY